MSEDIKPEIIKRTQDSLKKFVKKPPLTEKLLKKPPFRFLHDLISSIMKETGFLQGLYSAEEMISDNIKDRDAKVAYLEKLILAVKLATGANVSARPTKIVAGLEVDRTNELLQTIGKALEKKVDSRSAVEQVVNKGAKKSTGANKSQKTPGKNKHTKEIANEENKSEKSKKSSPKSNKDVSSKITKDNKKTKKNESNATPKKREKRESPSRKTETSPVKSKTLIKQSPIKETVEKQSSLDSENEKVRRASIEHASLASNELIKEKNIKTPELRTGDTSSPKKSSDTVVQNGSDVIKGEPSIQNQKENSAGRDGNGREELKGKTAREVEVRPESRRPGSAHSGHRRTESLANRKSFDTSVDDHSESNSEAIQNKPQAKIEPSTDASGGKAKTIQSKEVTVLGGTSLSQSSAKVINTPLARPKTATRPPSARPGAPRVRDRGHVQVTEEVSKSPSAVVNVIADSGPNNDEDDMDEGAMVVVEPQQSILESSDLIKEPKIIDGKPEDLVSDNLQGEEQGQLVAQILETKRELEISGPSSSKTEIDWEGGRKRERESTLKEVERLRSAIQSLTRAANPLGKLIDFLQEDVDSMQREYANWKEAYANSMADLRNEQSLTEASLEPLKLQLGELELLIQDELEKICSVKANILRNDDKIQRYLSGSKS